MGAEPVPWTRQSKVHVPVGFSLQVLERQAEDPRYNPLKLGAQQEGAGCVDSLALSGTFKITEITF